MICRVAVLAVAAGAGAQSAAAQAFDPVTTRAAGMAGAFVAVTDDASAVYWNPAALASGSFFSLVLDRTSAKATIDVPSLGGSRSATLIALGTPPFGASYYRLRYTWVSPPAVGSDSFRLGQSLITHNTGVTLLHSIANGLSVGTTLKLVRGIATSGALPPGDLDSLLDDTGDLIGKATNKFDADVGLAYVHSGFRAGLTFHNLANPKFEATDGTRLELESQARAGVSLSSPLGFLIAADLDLNDVRGALGRVQQFALGSEARFLPRAYARAGFRMNTLGGEPGGHAPVFTVGGSFAVLTSLWIDGQATVGSQAGGPGWGVAARVTF